MREAEDEDSGEHFGDGDLASLDLRDALHRSQVFAVNCNALRVRPSHDTNFCLTMPTTLADLALRDPTKQDIEVLSDASDAGAALDEPLSPHSLARAADDTQRATRPTTGALRPLVPPAW